jgi:hypothetical protein
MEFNPSNITTTNMKTNVGNITVNPISPEGAQAQDETTYINHNFTQYFAYYKKVAEVKSATDMMTHWVIGDGYISGDARTKVLLGHITGWGTDTFDDILENLDKISRINGDSFAEIIRDEKTNLLLNLKVLNPEKVSIVASSKGRLKGYDITQADGTIKRLSPEKVFHLSNKRVADEIHGTSDYESVENIINALNESFEDTKMLVHLNVYPVRFLECDFDDPTKLATTKTQYQTAIKNKEVILIPKGTISIVDAGLSNNATFNPLPWRETLKNQFYQMIGLPQILMGGAAEFSESSAKIAYLAFERTVKQRQRYLITQIKEQIGLEVEIDFPTSLQNELISDTKKDGAGQQTGFQPNDVIAGRGA